MKKLIMCRGLPASGKSTWAESQTNVIIVDSDDIRRNGYSKEFEELVQVEKRNKIRRALQAGKTVISTDPNLLPRHERELRAIARKYKAQFEIKEFDTPLEECIRRDSLRERKVGELAIKYWHERASLQQE